ncbi:MAG: hypothetical protein ACOYMT_05410, partial [Chthoniobacterales bacterium]
MPGLNRSSIRAALPAFHLNSPAHLVNVRGLRIAGEINPPVPHIPLAKSESNLIGRLIDADREVPVTKEETVLGEWNRLIQTDEMMCLFHLGTGYPMINIDAAECIGHADGDAFC